MGYHVHYAVAERLGPSSWQLHTTWILKPLQEVEQESQKTYGGSLDSRKYCGIRPCRFLRLFSTSKFVTRLSHLLVRQRESSSRCDGYHAMQSCRGRSMRRRSAVWPEFYRTSWQSLRALATVRLCGYWRLDQGDGSLFTDTY